MRKVGYLVLGGATGIMLGAVGAIFAPSIFQHSQNLTQPYVGQDARQISSLSPSDIEALKAGAGWGLAKPAELNGYPGPAHVLELADQLELDANQIRKVEHSFAQMQSKAKELGAALIDAEAALDATFDSGSITSEILAERIEIAENTRAALRNIHLTAHLEVTPLLTEGQKTKYATLRGYGDGHSGHAGH